jgi:prepilin-type N-terminal cleavage/methylation domain-containing protein
MSNNKGFTLIEILVVLIILGILVAVALPNYQSMVMQGAANAAQKNLIAIYNAEKAYYFTNTGYCTATSAGNAACTTSSNCADILSAINCNLGDLTTTPITNLNITDNNFTYSCTTAAGPSYTCTAVNNLHATFTLTVTGPIPTTPGSNPIVLPGGPGCPGAGCNPTCTYATNPAYCPS